MRSQILKTPAHSGRFLVFVALAVDSALHLPVLGWPF